ncbi:MAG TPA: aldehyde dehydrogenase family protein [Blastocatellia bacterium]|nr:aldehyde dehydrogenase family protein [Blastocatellia bacterium]
MNAKLTIADARPNEIVSLNPATLEELGRFRLATDADVEDAVARARAAQPAWAALSFQNRSRYVLKLRRTLYERQNEIINIISDETGKPQFEALTTEVFMVMDLMSHFAAKAERVLRDEKFTLAVFRNKRSMITYEPLGVVGVISPWNFPFSIPVGEIVMAVMAGNTVVLKPSEFTPLVGDAIKRLFADAGFPPGVLEVVQGDGSTGAALAESAVDKIFFTGSVRTGRKIAESAARRLKPVVLELGGKDPMIVCEDALFERTVKGAVWGAFVNCGQVCASVERLYVMEPIAEKFIAAVVEEVKKLRVGPPSADCSADVGPLANENQLNVVSDQVADAVAKGARVLVGARRREDLGGYFFEPTVLVDVNSSMKVMTEETFGPVLPIVVVKDEEEAIREANSTRYGLLASVWTRDNDRGRRIARKIEAGTVIINDAVYTHGAARTPWFGVKESGTGVTHGSAGLFEFVQMKHVNWDVVPLKSDWWWYPYTEKWQGRFKTLAKVLYRWGLRKIA